MPDHFHGIIVPNLKRGSISDVMRNIKYRTARDIRNLDENNNLYNNYASRGRPGLPLRVRGNKIWQKSFYDKIIRNEKQLNQTIRYIHINPQKHGFADDYKKWKYSSYRNYYLKNDSMLKIDLVNK